MPRLPLGRFTIHVLRAKGDFPILDASMAGIAFTADTPFAPGKSIVMDIEDMERVRVRKIKCSIVHHTGQRVGCSFYSLSRKQTKDLQELLLSVREAGEEDFPVDMDSTLDLDLGMI